jgi:hypothetical protein
MTPATAGLYLPAVVDALLRPLRGKAGVGPALGISRVLSFAFRTLYGAEASASGMLSTESRKETLFIM